MERMQIVSKSVFIGLTARIITIIAGFLTRTLMIRILGVEILGLNGTIADCISMLALAELGLTNAMIFRLYKPLNDENWDLVSKLLKIYQCAYRLISIAVFLIGVFMGFFLKLIIKDISFEWGYIYLVYYLQVAASSLSYLFAYKRVLLSASQKTYVCMFNDTIILIISTILKCLIIIFWKNYILYLVIVMAQNIFSNVCLSAYCNLNYKHVSNRCILDKKLSLSLLHDIKDVFSSRIATYIFSSTDNILISAFVGTTIVGYVSNYKYISMAVNGLVSSGLSAMQPIIGNYLNSDTTMDHAYLTLRRYAFVRYAIAILTSIPLICLANDFVDIWAGEQYVMSMSIIMLIVIDYYFSVTHGVLGEYIIGMGLFRKEKVIDIIGAVSNILLSLLGIKYFGIVGVLAGTAISEIMICMGKLKIVFSDILKERNQYMIPYIKLMLKYHITTIIAFFLSYVTLLNISLDVPLICLSIKAIVSLMISVAVLIICNYKSDELSFIKSAVWSVLKNRIGR